MLSASVADSGNSTTAPVATFSEAGQDATMGCAPGPLQVPSGDNPLRGAGVPTAKSLPFWSVSVQPPSARNSAVLDVSAGAALPSKKLALP